MNNPNPIARIHGIWNKATGQNIPLGVCSYEIEHGWHQWLKAGYGESDLLMVVSYLQGEIRKGERRPAALRWSNCIGDVLRFAEEVQLAKAEKRNLKTAPSPREKIVAAFRACDPVPATTDAKHVSELIANLKKAAGMKI